MENTWHVLPINDSRPHEEVETDCPCCPKIEYQENGVLVIHNAFDGREILEQAQEKIRQN